MEQEILVPLQQATEVGDQPPWSVTPPELVQAVNVLPDQASDALAVRPDLVDADHQANVDGFYGVAYDALGAVAVVPASGVPVNATASGPRDAMGASLGETVRLSGEIVGRIFRCPTCIADRVRPGYYARIAGEGRLFEVARLVSAFACELDAEPTLQGRTSIDFVAGWGKAAGRLGIATDIVGATLVIGPCNPAAANPVRMGGPLLADLEEQDTGAVMAWETAVVPWWPDDFDPRSVTGLAFWRGALYVAWGENNLAISTDGGRRWAKLGHLPWSDVTALFAAGGRLFAASGTGLFACDSGNPLVPGSWSLAHGAGAEILFAFAAGARRDVPPRLVVVTERSWSTETSDRYEATVKVLLADGTLLWETTSPTDLFSPGNRVLAADASVTDSGLVNVFVLSELGELFLVTQAGGWAKWAAGDFKGPRPASRPFRRAGVVVTEVQVEKATPSLPVFLSASAVQALVILEDIRTVSSTGQTSFAVFPGLAAFTGAFEIFGTAVVTPPPAVGAEPVGRVHHLEAAGRCFAAWIDWRGQFFAESLRIESLANAETTSLLSDAGSPAIADRGIGFVFDRSARPCGAIAARGFTGSDAAFLDVDGVATRLDGSAVAKVAQQCVAAAGGPNVIAFADGAAVKLLQPDLSTVDISGTFPDPTAVDRGTASGAHLVLGASLRSELYAAPLDASSWTTIVLSSQIVWLYGASDGFLAVTQGGAVYFDGSLAQTSVPLPPEAVTPLTGGGALGSGNVAIVDADGRVFTGPAAGPLSLLGYGPPAAALCTDPGSGSPVVAGLGLPAPMVIQDGWLSTGTGATSRFAHQSGKSVSYLGLPLWIGDAGRLRLVDVGQRRGDAAVTDGAVVASVTGRGVAEVRGANRGLAVLSGPLLEGAALDGAGNLVASSLSGQLLKLDQSGNVTLVGTLGAGPIYVGGDGPAFAASEIDLAIVSGTDVAFVGLASPMAAAAAGRYCSVLEQDNLAIVRDDGYVSRYPLGEHAGVSGAVPVAAQQTPLILVPTGVSRRRGAPPDVSYKLFAYRGWDWRLLGTAGTFTAPVSAVAAHGRITLMAERLLDVSSWGGGFFTPASRNFWSPVWATADGMLVLFGPTELEDGKLVHYRRRVRWSAPLAPRDFDTLEASGLAELYPDTGEFLAACGLSHAIIYADEGGLGILEPTGAPEAPWSHRRLAEGVVPATAMVRVGGSAMFIGRDGGLWVANPAGAQKVQGRVPLLKYGVPLEEIGLCALPRLGFVAAWSPGRRFASLSDMRTGRTTTIVQCPDSRWEATIQSIADGSPVGEDLLISYSWLTPGEIPLVKFGATYDGVDRIQGFELPWIAAVVTGVIPPTTQGGFTASLVRVDGSGLNLARVWADVVESSTFPKVAGIPATLDGDELLAGAPVLDRLPASRNAGTLRLHRPWWAEGMALLDSGGAPVPFTPLDDLTVSVPAGIDIFVAQLPAYGKLAVVRAGADVIAPAGTAIPLDLWTAAPETGYPFPWTSEVLLLPIRQEPYGRITAAAGAARSGRGHAVAVVLQPGGERVVLTTIRLAGGAAAWRQQTA